MTPELRSLGAFISSFFLKGTGIRIRIQRKFEPNLASLYEHKLNFLDDDLHQFLILIICLVETGVQKYIFLKKIKYLFIFYLQ